MDYREFEPPQDLRHLVKVAWSLDVPADGPAWVAHTAVPDGCMELIHRLRGRSKWDGDQPETFVAGVITQPTKLELAANSSFVGVRIWPWAWRALTGLSPATLVDRWESLERPQGVDLPESVEALFGLLAAVHGPDPDFIAKLLRSRNCAEVSERTGLSARSLQRWFERHVGLPPRLWLRLLRFSDAFADLPEATTSLAEHALDHGYADQAHMAREFRLLAGAPAGTARRHGKGPFLSPD